MEKTIVSAFSSDDKDKDKDKDSGGILSFFGGDKDDKDKDDGGLFSFGRDDEKKKDKKDDENDGFFSRLLNRDGDDDKTKKSGFHGLFNEQQGAAGSHGDQEGKDSEGGGVTFGGGGGGSGVSEGGEEILPSAGQQWESTLPLLSCCVVFQTC